MQLNVPDGPTLPLNRRRRWRELQVGGGNPIEIMDRLRPYRPAPVPHIFWNIEAHWIRTLIRLDAATDQHIAASALKGRASISASHAVRTTATIMATDQICGKRPRERRTDSHRHGTEHNAARRNMTDNTWPTVDTELIG